MAEFINIHTHKTDSLNINIFNIKYNEKIDYKLCSFGLHPWDIDKCNVNNYLNKLNNLCKNNKIAAVGEIGIDRVINTSVDIQKDIYIKQVAIAEKYNLPVIIHCVKAYSDFFEILKKHTPKTPMIFHGYNSNLQTAEKLIEKKCFLSFGQQLLTNKKLQEVFKQIPVNNIFFETDNSIEKIENIYKKAAEIYQINIDNLKTQIFSNFANIFKSDLLFKYNAK